MRSDELGRRGEPRPLHIAMLGMPDNHCTRIVLAELANRGISVQTLVFVKPNWKMQWQRFKRKLMAAGIIATFERVVYALRSRRSQTTGGGTEPALPQDVHWVDDFNGRDCRELLAQAGVDLLLLCTDSMIGRGTFSLARIATLNAHPGWLPQYRGLGALLAQMRDGYLPSITVHQVDEGVDTGPIVLRRDVNLPFEAEFSQWDEVLDRHKGRLFAEVIELYRDGNARYLDTFAEPSNMTRGVSAKEADRIRCDVQAQPSRLRPIRPIVLASRDPAEAPFSQH